MKVREKRRGRAVCMQSNTLEMGGGWGVHVGFTKTLLTAGFALQEVIQRLCGLETEELGEL